MPTSILEIKAVSKYFPGVRALHDVSFDVQRGEVLALMGENGAGKSTLMKLLSGVYPDYDGEIAYNGQTLHLRNPRDAQGQGIAIIHQELNLIPELSIAENIFLGREPKTRWGTLDRARMESETRALLERLNLPLPANRLVKTLRVGEQQLIEVAKALSLEARLLMLDEPTSALSETEIEHLFEVITALKSQGVTMIYISHKLDEIFRISDRITVLRDGQFIGTRETQQTNEAELIQMMVGREMTELFPKEPAEVGDEVLRVENLSLRPAARQGQESGSRALHEISFELRRG
ncbi:MAG: ribose transport system ATP-binding protein, partial [Abditibacteriota bacterium]|nr:ribose transport system ATP-binding protein [Abditibacteriota bacterium]